MTLKYAGPKPIISHTGIEFDTNKEDKYVYLNIAIQFIKALDHKYIKDKKYIYKTEKRFSPNELETELKKYCEDYEKLLDKQSHNIEDEIQENLTRAQENRLLNEIEKKVLVNNINIMHDYMVQRSVNKAVYYCVMQKLANLAKKDHIEYITAPMFQPFYHVLHTLQGTLLKEKFPIDTELEIYKEKEQLLITLKVVNL